VNNSVGLFYDSGGAGVERPEGLWLALCSPALAPEGRRKNGARCICGAWDFQSVLTRIAEPIPAGF